jgi:protein-disulfide isomerase
MKLSDRLWDFWKNNKTAIIIVLSLVVVVINVLLYPGKNYPVVSEERLAIEPFLGSEDAVITIIEYGDYACSGCKLWHNAGVLDEILSLYEGKLKFVWRDNAHISTASIAAANAAHCAYDQDKFWEYHDLLYENPRGFSDEGLKAYAVDLGLDQDQFSNCVDQKTYYKKVFYNMNLAGEHGLSVTPAFLVNEEVIIGPPPTSYLVEVIDRLVNEIE